jgi:hypothetical protein
MVAGGTAMKLIERLTNRVSIRQIGAHDKEEQEANPKFYALRQTIMRLRSELMLGYSVTGEDEEGQEDWEIDRLKASGAVQILTGVIFGNTFN